MTTLSSSLPLSKGNAKKDVPSNTFIPPSASPSDAIIQEKICNNHNLLRHEASELNENKFRIYTFTEKQLREKNRLEKAMTIHSLKRNKMKLGKLDENKMLLLKRKEKGRGNCYVCRNY